MDISPRHRTPQFQSSDMVHEARSDWRQSMAPGHESVGTCQTLTDTDGTHGRPNTPVFAHECGSRCLATMENRSGVTSGIWGRMRIVLDSLDDSAIGAASEKNSLANFAQDESFRGENSRHSDKNWRWSSFFNLISHIRVHPPWYCRSRVIFSSDR